MRNFSNEIVNLPSKELPKYLCGYGSYYISYSEFYPVYQPTDMHVIIEQGLYKAFLIEPRIREEFENALVLLATGTAFEVYTASYYLWMQCINEKKNESPFQVDKQKIGAVLRNGIMKHRNEIQKYIIDYHGDKNSDAWDDIERWNAVFSRHFSFSIIA